MRPKLPPPMRRGESEYQAQMKQAMLIVVFQMFAFLVALLVYWNFTMVQPYLNPIFWSLVWCTVLHSTKTKLVDYLMCLDDALDARCHEYKERNCMYRHLMRFWLLPHVLLVDLWHTFFGERDSSLGFFVDFFASWDIAVLTGFVACVIISCFSLLSSDFLSSSFVTLLPFFLTVAAISCFFFAMFVLLPRLSRETYSSLVAMFLVLFFVIFIGLTCSFVVVKVIEEGNSAADAANQLYQRHRPAISKLLTDLKVEEYFADYLQDPVWKEWRTIFVQFAALGGRQSFKKISDTSSVVEPPSFLTPFDVVIFDNSSAYPTETPTEHPQTAPTSSAHPTTADDVTNVILALFDDAIAQVPSSSPLLDGDVDGEAADAANSSIGFISRINNLVNGALALNSEQWESLFSFLPGLMQRIFGIGQNVTSALATVVTDILEIFFGFVSFGVDFVVFLACLYYLLENEYSPLECVSLLMPVDLSKSEVVIESLTSSIKGIFQTTFVVAVVHGIVTWVTFLLLGLPFPFLAAFISAFVAVVPLCPSWLVCVPGVVSLLWTGRYAELMFVFAIFFALTYVDPVIYGQIDNSHPYLTGLSIVLGLGTFGTVGAILGPMLVCLTVTIFTVWGKFIPREEAEARRRTIDLSRNSTMPRMKKRSFAETFHAEVPSPRLADRKRERERARSRERDRALSSGERPSYASSVPISPHSRHAMLNGRRRAAQHQDVNGTSTTTTVSKSGHLSASNAISSSAANSSATGVLTQNLPSHQRSVSFGAEIGTANSQVYHRERSASAASSPSSRSSHGGFDSSPAGLGNFQLRSRNDISASSSPVGSPRNRSESQSMLSRSFSGSSLSERYNKYSANASANASASANTHDSGSSSRGRERNGSCPPPMANNRRLVHMMDESGEFAVPRGVPRKRRKNVAHSSPRASSSSDGDGDSSSSSASD